MPQADTNLYIGIDPGASGGICSCWGDHYPSADKLPPDEKGVWDLLKYHLRTAGYSTPLAVIEQVGGFIEGTPRTGSSMFKFGQSYGSLRMALVAAGVRFEAIPPATWQRAVGVSPRKKGEPPGTFKNRLKARAIELYPELGVTLATCDAALLMHYAKHHRYHDPFGNAHREVEGV